MESKEDLIEIVQKSQNCTKGAAKVMVDAVFEALVTGLQNDGDKLVVKGFGKFEVKMLAARQGFNPQTKEPIAIPERLGLRFKASDTYTDSING